MAKSYERQNGGPFRNGRVTATDSRFTGEEPTWEGVSTWTPEEIMAERDRALRFYNYYLSPGDVKPSLLQWMVESKSFTQEDIDAIESAPDHSPNSAASKLCRSILRGMPPSQDDLTFINTKINETLDDVRCNRFKVKKSAESESKPQVPMSEKIRQKVSRTVLQTLEGDLDQWLASINDLSDDQVSDIHKLLEKVECPPQGIYLIQEWIDKKLKEFEAVVDGTDDQLVEAYKIYPAKCIKNWIKHLQTMQSGIATYVASKKALRKPRAKKSKPAEKQVAKVKYMTSCKEFNVTSISPQLIIGANHLWLFNAKYRNLQYYEADGPTGLSVKGTTVKGWDEKKSWKMSLRKPDQILPIVVSKTFLQIEREIKKLTTKVREPNGRINEETIILRALV
jgi:hypothetical protein